MVPSITVEFLLASFILYTPSCNFFMVNAYTLTDEQNLHDSILSGYKANLRPGANRLTLLNVSMSFHIFFIKEFQENSGKFTVNGVFVMEWTDERLAWNSSAYNNMTKTIFPQKQIWIPNLVNINPYNDIYGLGSELMSVEVTNEGSCRWIPYQSFDVICDADVTNYPFDTQLCSLNFFMWGYKNDSVKLHFTSSVAGFSLYKEHGLWDVVNSKTFLKASVHGYEEVVVGLWLQRRTAFYISSLIIPMFSISLLMGLVFLLPPESGERVGFITTVLLSYIVFLTIIQDKLPESSEPSLSIIGYILSICVLNGAITTALVILGLRLHNSSNDQPVPQFIRKIVSCKRKGTKVENSDVDKPNIPFDAKSDSTDINEGDITWTDVGNFFDKLCMIICTLEIIVLIIVYFYLVL